jgi:methionine biosynthesis protein MetW
MSKYTSGIKLSDKNSTSTMIFEKIKNKSEVFDVGCASGYLAEILVKEKGCKVVGLEIDEADATLAEKFCELVLRDDIETSGWEKKLKDRKFDHIIFADVLEHLKDPEKVLARVKNFLKPEGSVLISIPNIAHVSVRLELLGGKFVPESTGILDNTHLKYFTKENFSSLAKRAGYRINEVFQSTFDFPEEQINKILEKIGLSSTKEAIKEFSSPEAVAYQYFFELKIGDSINKEKQVEAKKPIYVVRELIHSVEEDHKSFKLSEKQARLELQEENKVLRREIKNLENRLEALNGYFIIKLAKNAKKIFRKFG